MEILNRTFGFERYKKNLRVDVVTDSETKVTTCYVVSYETRVAVIDFKRKEVNILEWVARDENGRVICTSKTTSKHINYVAKDFNFKVVSQF